MANSTSRSRLAAVCLYLGFGKGGRRWISLHDRLARHESAMTANTLCSDTSHIPDWPCRFLYPAAFSRPYFYPTVVPKQESTSTRTRFYAVARYRGRRTGKTGLDCQRASDFQIKLRTSVKRIKFQFSDKMRKCIAEDLFTHIR